MGAAPSRRAPVLNNIGGGLSTARRNLAGVATSLASTGVALVQRQHGKNKRRAALKAALKAARQEERVGRQRLRRLRRAQHSWSHPARQLRQARQLKPSPATG